MKKKIALGVVAIVAVAGGVAGMSAFEAHVINVTAKIENALRVDTTEIDFGTVFPQEQLEKPLEIALSQSFLDERRVDDVEYVIRQKPKCGLTNKDGTELVGPTATGHVNVDPATGAVTIDCGPEPAEYDPAIHNWGVLPDLCPYISKHPDRDPENDGFLNSFHLPWTVVGGGNDPFGLRWNDTRGHLAKRIGDLVDNWTIDLAVPCFGDHCAQDWEDFVTRVNPDVLNPDVYVQDPDNEHKIFGCDLWIEVFGISLPPGLGCSEKVDVMLVLDRSGSIDTDELTTMQTAAKAFVDALAPAADGAHMGQTSFSDGGSLDLHLTDSAVAIKAAIDALATGGFTNLKEGIELATGELENPGDGHDRADGESPDFMVIITDGAPNRPDPLTAEADAKAAADAAKADGIEIFVVGVGTSSDTAIFLRDDIASSSGHYFDAADFDDLEDILKGLTVCNGVI